jgi:membrane associated rhomboid family serine protease
MSNKTSHELPAITYLFAMVLGLFLFMVFGGPVFGVEPNLVWIAAIAGFLFALATIWVWNQWRSDRRK